MEDVAHLAAAQRRVAADVEVGQIAAADEHSSGRRLFQRAGKVQQRALATAAGPHDGDELAGLDAQRHAAEGAHLGRACAEALDHVHELHCRCWFHRSVLLSVVYSVSWTAVGSTRSRRCRANGGRPRPGRAALRSPAGRPTLRRACADIARRSRRFTCNSDSSTVRWRVMTRKAWPGPPRWPSSPSTSARRAVAGRRTARPPTTRPAPVCPPR